jgi:hypothetical protein
MTSLTSRSSCTKTRAGGFIAPAGITHPMRFVA